MLRRLTLAVLVFSHPLWALPEVGLTVSERNQVESGGIAVRLDRVPGATIGTFTITGYVNAPASAVWFILTDYDRYRQLYPEILKFDVRRRNGETDEHFSLFDYPWPLQDRWVVTRVVHDRSAWTIRWERIEGTVKQTAGSWHLIPDGMRTLVVYRVRVDPGLPGVPDWFIQWGTGRIAPRLIQRIRDTAHPPTHP